MNTSFELAAPAIEGLAWALIHSFWQGAIVAFLLALALRALRRNSASTRHAISLLALLTIFTAVVVTATLVSPNASSQNHITPLVPAASPMSESVIPSDPPKAARKPAMLSDSDQQNSLGTNHSVVAAQPWRARLTPLLPWITGTWISGVLILCLRLCCGWWRIRALQRSGSIVEERIRRMFDQLIISFGLRRAVRLVRSTDTLTPMLTGVFKPMIILPARVVTGLGPAEIEAILAHEIAHFVRRDAWSNLFQVLVETVLFYHPAVWWISRRARIEREHAADDLALQVCGDRRTYAGALVRLAELDVEPALVIAATGGDLASRIRRILAPRPAESTSLGLSLGLPAIIALFTLSAAFSSRPATLLAQEKPSPPKSSAESAPKTTPVNASSNQSEDESQTKDRQLSESWIADAYQLEDAAKRTKAIEQIRSAMTSADADEVRAGTKTFIRLGPIEFDKVSFRPLVRGLLASKDPATRSAAASAFTLTGVEPDDLPRIFALADDPEPQVRDGLTYIVVQVTKHDLTGKAASDAILKLMQKLPRDERNVAHALWGSKFSPEIEAKVLEYCRDMTGFGVGYNFFYGALSTQANKSEASVKRLIEILADQDTTNKAGRAAWGLRQGVDRAQFPLVADAMVRVIEARSDGYLRNGALNCLRSYATSAQAPALKAILAKPGVTGEFRKGLVELIAAIESRPAIKTEQADSTPITAASSPSPSIPAKAEIEVQWNGQWWPATVLEKDGDRTRIHYVGYGSEWDEWVTKERIRPLSATPPSDEAARSAADNAAQLVETNRRAARVRAAQDRQYYNREQLSEIETLYQVANTKGKRSAEARASLKQLLDKYDKANRTGCATLYLGQASEGDERLEYLTRAVEKFSDCFYFNGCQVGGYGRYVLALTLWDRGEKEKARKMLEELKTTYKDATDHRGQPMGKIAEAVEKELEQTK